MIDKNLRTIREALGITQAEVEERCGLPPKYVSHVEGGRRKPSYDNLAKLCAGLGCTPNRLMGIGV